MKRSHAELHENASETPDPVREEVEEPPRTPSHVYAKREATRVLRSFAGLIPDAERRELAQGHFEAGIALIVDALRERDES